MHTMIEYRTAFDGTAWVVTRNAVVVSRSKALATSRVEMNRRARGESIQDRWPVRTITQLPDGTTFDQVFAPGGELVTE